MVRDIALFALFIVEVFLGGGLMSMTVRRFLPLRFGRVSLVLHWFLFSFVILYPSWMGDENSLYLLPFFLAAFLVFCGGPWYARLVTGMAFYALLVPLNMMVDSLYSFSGHLLLADEWFDTTLKLLLWFIIWLAVRRFTLPGVVGLRSKKLWALLGVLALAPLGTTLSFTVWNFQTLREDVAVYAMRAIGYTALPFVVVSAMAVLAAMVVLSNHEALEQAQSLADMRQVYYSGLQREQTEVRTLRHDMHNHLTAVQTMLATGSSQDAQRYLAELSRSPVLQGARRLCGNEAANAVLASKAALMERAGLAADWEVSLPPQLSVADVDLCALLGNALDNAMEAAGKAADKRVTLRARADKGMLMLRVENALAAPLPRGGGFATTKADKKAHGFGLAGMRDIARRYGGSLEARAGDGRFELVVYMPLAGPAPGGG